MKIYAGLKSKLYGPLIIIFIIVFFTSSITIINRETNEARESIIVNSISYSNLSVKYILDTYDLYFDSGYIKFIEKISQIISMNENVYRIQILNLNGKILFDSNEIISGRYNEIESGERYIDNKVIIEQLSYKNSSVRFDEDNINYEIIQPFPEEWGRHDYSLRYFYSLESLNTLNNKILIEVLFSIGLSILISFLIIFYIYKLYITQPINKLLKGMKKIKSGLFDYRINIEAKDEIGELTTSFNEMADDLKSYKETLEKLIDDKDQLLLQIGHDLKTPLGPITNLLDVLEGDISNSERKEILPVLKKNVNYMQNLVVKSLEIARLNSIKSDSIMEEINIKNEINNIIENKKYMLDNKNIIIQNIINNDSIIQSDQYEFEILISNILENAINYNIDGGKITIDSEELNEHIMISIKDTGIGMSEDQLKHAFDEFYKGDSSRQHLESTGLGLAICKRIIEKIKGKIWMESKGFNKGTVVYIQIPLHKKNIKN